MFHLLMSFGGWSDSGTDTIGTSRIYINNTDSIGNRFFTNGELDISKISSIPALLVAETDSESKQMAFVAYITNISMDPRNTTIQYVIDRTIDPISNADLEKHSDEIGISSFRFRHTHWEVKNTDLFKLLLKNRQQKNWNPTVFNIDNQLSQDDLVSVMMPFQAEFNNTFDSIKQATTQVGLDCVRADNFWENQFIIQDIVDLISKAKIVICDFSTRNNNVFYEAGIAHTLGKEIIIITQSDDDVPFDLRHIRYIKYLNNTEGLFTLSEKIKSRIETLLNR